MGIKRIVDTGFWTDGKVEDFSPEDKYFMMYLLTNPFTTQLGIYEFKIKQAAFHLGYTPETIYVLLERFEKSYDIIKFSKQTKEVAIKNFLRHSIVKGGAPVRDCLVKEIKNVKNKELLEWVFSHIKNYENLNDTVKSIIAEYEEKHGLLCYCNEKEKGNEKENNNENENENENDVSWYDSSNDSSNESLKPPKAKPMKHKHGEYKNVLLTDSELEKLKEEYPDWQDRIERLSSYVASTGKKYKSHYATIRNWAKKDAENPQPQKVSSKNKFNNFPQRKYDMDAYERMLLNKENPPPTAGENAEIQAKVDELKKKLGVV